MPSFLKTFAQVLSADRFATALLFIGLWTVACLIPAQNDTWWQLRTGEAMWQSRQIMMRDEFTHTVAGQYWPNHEWLTQVIFYGVFQIGGLPLLTAVCAAAVVTGWFLTALLTPGSIVTRMLLIGCGAGFTTASWSLRPQTFSLALFAATLWILVRRRFFWALPPLFLIWANLHGAVATGGLLLVAAAAVSAIIARDHLVKLLVIGVLCFAATTTTPLGFSFWLEIPESLQRLKTYEVIEWRAPSLTNPGDFPFWIIVAGLGVLIWRRREALRTWEPAFLALASALTLILALRSTRNFSTFILCAVPTAGMLLAEPARHAPTVSTARSTMPSLILAVCVLASASFIAFAWWLPLPRLAWHPVSEEMRAAIAACEGPLYNRYDEGGYIIWFLKGRRVFMDSRQDPFPEEMVLEQIQLERSGDYQSMFDRYGVGCALTPERSPLAHRLALDGWSGRRAGAGWTVFSKPASATQSPVF
jgi:hypothetical protein